MEKKIPIRGQGKLTVYVLPADIEYLKAQRAYCDIHFKNKTSVTVSMSIGEFAEKFLSPALFCLVHRSFCVNIDEIGWYDNHHYLILKNDTHIPVLDEGKKKLLEMGFIL